MDRWCQSSNIFKFKDSKTRCHVVTTSRIKIQKGSTGETVRAVDGDDLIKTCLSMDSLSIRVTEENR